MATKKDPERRTARAQRDSGAAAESQKSAGPTTRKSVPATHRPRKSKP